MRRSHCCPRGVGGAVGARPSLAPALRTFQIVCLLQGCANDLQSSIRRPSRQLPIRRPSTRQLPTRQLPTRWLPTRRTGIAGIASVGPHHRRRVTRMNPRLRSLLEAVAPAALVLLFQQVVFPTPLGVTLQGAVLGLLNAMVVLGLILVYRANRVINFAQASIGAFPAATAGAIVLFGAPSLTATAVLATAAGGIVGLRSLTVGRRPPIVALGIAIPVVVFCGIGIQVAPGLGWAGGFGAGIVVAVLCGLGTDTIVIRRLSSAPRLVVTVATIGLAQFFAILGLLVPRMWGEIVLIDPTGDRTGFDVPFRQSVTIGTTVFGTAELFAVLISGISLVVVTVALRRTSVGIAVRAAADSGERASMLGVPVPRLEAGVWVVASVLAFLATYAQAGILGLELTPGVGLRVMVAALAAMAIGGFRSIPAQLLAAVSIGVLIQATGPSGGYSLTLTDAILAALVIVGLLVRKTSERRSDRDSTSSWQSAAEPRSLPFELAHLPVLRVLRTGALVVVVGVAAALPILLGESDILRASTLLALMVIALSVVVVTGWTGSVTLGQMSFAAAGAAVAAWTTLNWRVDLSLAILLGGLAGAVVALIVGLPSIRRTGIFLAVSTLAFALAATNYLFNPTVATWIPTEDVARRPLFGVWDLESRHRMYTVALVVMIACFAGVAGVRRTRVGRVLRAVRDNPQGAQAYGVNVLVARLMAFGLSGFLAGVGGVLLFAIQQRYEVALFGANESLNVFISAVVGGAGSILGAALGAILLDGTRGFLTGPIGLLPSAVGVLGVLLLVPGGISELVYRWRDRALRSYAERGGIHVPSLVADRRVVDPVAHLSPSVDDVSTTAGPDAQTPAVAAVAPVLPPVVVGEPGWLSVRSLDVAYDRVQVLFGVNIDIPRGEITALLGTNGAGKSTLLKAIGGVAPVTGGTLHFDGVDLASLRPEQVPAHGIVQMPGGHGVFPSLTVEENLRVAAWLFRRDRADANVRIAEARAHFPILEDRGHDAAADLSGGQQQQLALAMALLAKPKVLLIDELSVGLAPTVVEQLLGELRTLRDQGTTIVIVEQSVNVALTVADHAYFMEKGEIRFSGAASALLEQPDLVRSVYLKGAQEALASPVLAGGEASAIITSSSQGLAGMTTSADTSRAPALEVKGLSVTFGGNAAVRDVSFSVRTGEVVGLIGPNGAGKTTIFDLISGFTATDAGRVLIHGVDVTGNPPSGRARLGIGRSFQDARLFPGLTVSETIAVGLERWIEGDGIVGGAFRLPATRIVEKHIAERVEELIELFGLTSFRSKRIGELSTGSRRMVDLACVVAQAPSVVMLDEPTSGIAQREAEALGPLLLGLRDRLDATLLVIEHDIALISSISDRLIALDQGAIVTEGPPGEVLDHPEVVASYLGTGSATLSRSDHSTGASR